jgi:hypothetical protein
MFAGFMFGGFRAAGKMTTVQKANILFRRNSRHQEIIEEIKALASQKKNHAERSKLSWSKGGSPKKADLKALRSYQRSQDRSRLA